MHSSSPAGLAQHHRDHGPSAIHTGLAFERVVLLHRHEAIPLVEGHVPRVRRLEVAAQPRGIRAVHADLEQLRADTLALRCGRRAYELQVAWAVSSNMTEGIAEIKQFKSPRKTQQFTLKPCLNQAYFLQLYIF